VSELEEVVKLKQIARSSPVGEQANTKNKVYDKNPEKNFKI